MANMASMAGDDPLDLEPLLAPEEEELYLLPEATLVEVAQWRRPGQRTARLIWVAICLSCSCCAASATTFLADCQLLPGT